MERDDGQAQGGSGAAPVATRARREGPGAPAGLPAAWAEPGARPSKAAEAGRRQPRHLQELLSAFV